jgi:hypothetical protein
MTMARPDLLPTSVARRSSSNDLLDMDILDVDRTDAGLDISERYPA